MAKTRDTLPYGPDVAKVDSEQPLMTLVISELNFRPTTSIHQVLVSSIPSVKLTSRRETSVTVSCFKPINS